MVGKQENFIIDPKLLFDYYKDSTLQETREVLRDTLFGMLETMDVRNLKLHDKMFRIYGLAVCSLIIIFIPMIWVLFIK